MCFIFNIAVLLLVVRMWRVAVGTLSRGVETETIQR